ncbi:MAG: toprim domain-containing protein, partial [Flammeovirgaceae bacterium]
DKTPSMQVYYKTQTCYCFSSNCPTNGKSLDVIDVIMYKEKCSKHEAILKAVSMIEGTSNNATVTREEFLTKMFTYFKNAVYNAKTAQAYINARSLDYNQIEIGYNAAQFHHGNRKDETLLKNCVEYGLLKPTNRTNARDKETNVYNVFGKFCIAFALRNKANQVSGLYFRSTINDTDQKHFYLKDRQGLYPSYPNADTKKLILTEAIIDAATLMQVDTITADYSILSCYGTNGFTDEHGKAISELAQLEEVIFFFDGDEAGRKAVEKYTETIKQLRPSVKITNINTPENEDINSLAQGHELGVLTHLVEKRNDQRFIFSFEKKKAEPVATVAEEKTQNPSAKKTDAPQPERQQQKILLNATLDTTNPERIVFETESLHITIWGGIEKENLSRLRISVHVRSKNDKYKTYRDDCNLYSHPQVKKLVQSISESLELPSPHVSQTITELTEKLEAYRLAERNTQLIALRPKQYEMTNEEQKQAEKFLKGKDLTKATLKLITQSGLIGEQKNGLLLYFLYLSRITDEPLHAIIFGKSGSGKTYLQTKVSECLPEEAVRTVTSLSENTLYYSPKGFWEHKVLLIEDLEGVYNAFLPLREFMSKQSISKLTTDKDAKGNNVQKVLTVEGPICVSGATTKESIYEDNANRSFLIHIDERAGHTDEVMEFQRKQKAGLVNEQSQTEARQLLQNAQRLLQNIKVINPYALELRIPDLVFKKLRTNMHYLRLIEIVTLYHQCQREVKTDNNNQRYIETNLDDIAIANWLVKETLLRKSDELSGEQREFFESLKSKGSKENTFFAKDLRKTLRIHPMKLSRFLVQLESRGYIKRTGGNRQQGFEYQVNEWDDYKILKEGIDILDKKLEGLRQKLNGKAPLSHVLHTLSQK